MAEVAAAVLVLAGAANAPQLAPNSSRLAAPSLHLAARPQHPLGPRG